MSLPVLKLPLLLLLLLPCTSTYSLVFMWTTARFTMSFSAARWRPLRSPAPPRLDHCTVHRLRQVENAAKSLVSRPHTVASYVASYNRVDTQVSYQLTSGKGESP